MTKSQWKDKWQQIRIAFNSRDFAKAKLLRSLYPACFGGDRLVNRASIRANHPALSAIDFLELTVGEHRKS